MRDIDRYGPGWVDASDGRTIAYESRFQRPGTAYLAAADVPIVQSALFAQRFIQWARCARRDGLRGRHARARALRWAWVSCDAVRIAMAAW